MTSIDSLVAAFEDCTLPPAELHHKEHVQIALWLLQHEPAHRAIVRFVGSLRRYAAHIGKPGVYHETITWAYLMLINERLERGGRQRSWVEFERDEADLFARDFLHAYYRPETLASELARRVFVFPDRGSAGLPIAV